MPLGHVITGCTSHNHGLVKDIKWVNGLAGVNEEWIEKINMMYCKSKNG